MREIKFRGKRVDNGEWIFGDVVQWGSKGLCAILPTEGDKWSNPYDFEVIPETVGQFTGLNDKNGVEIYEDDELQYIDIDGKTYNGQIVYKNAAFDILGNWNEWLGEGYADECLVIGNIHDK